MRYTWQVTLHQMPPPAVGWYGVICIDGEPVDETEPCATPNEAAILALEYQVAWETGER